MSIKFLESSVYRSDRDLTEEEYIADINKGAVTLGNFSCNLSRNFVATQVTRNIA